VLLNKPVKLPELSRTIDRLLPAATAPPTPSPAATAREGAPTVFIVDDDAPIRAAIGDVIAADGGTPVGFATGEAFLAAYRPGRGDCLLIDAYLPGMNGIELLTRLREAGHLLPAIVITGNSDVAMAVRAMKAGAADFIEKPIAAADLLASLHRALERSSDNSKLIAWQDSAAEHIIGLTPRQRQIMDLVLAGHPSKNIAADLGISQRTVENHRASIMKTTGTRSLPALARLALAAAVSMQFRPRQTEGEEKKAVLF
jgi:two-component system CheB/CheR fusion protein